MWWEKSAPVRYVTLHYATLHTVTIATYSEQYYSESIIIIIIIILIKRLTSKRPLGAVQNVKYKYKKCEKSTKENVQKCN